MPFSQLILTIRYALLLFLFLLTPQIEPQNPPTKDTDKDFQTLHQKSTVVDLHVDTLYQMLSRGYLLSDKKIVPKGYNPEVTIQLLEQGGVNAEVFAIWVPSHEMKNPQNYAVHALEAYRQMTLSPSRLVAAQTSSDVYRANQNGKIAALLSIEGAEAIGKEANALHAWKRDGLSLLGIVWNRPNAFADAAQEKIKPFGGLSEEGKHLVDLAGELGILLDVSHASRQSFWDIMARTRRPVIASHSGANSIFPHLRNLDDEQIRAIRTSGGVIGINFHKNFLSSKPKVSIETVVTHILHMIDIGDASVVALGSDFDGNINTPIGLSSIGTLPSLTKVLLSKNLLKEDISLFLGRNFLRSLQKAQGEFPLEANSIPIPLPIQTMHASSALAKHTVSQVFDRNQKTFWKASPGDKNPTITFSGTSKPPKRIALRSPLSAHIFAKIRLEVAKHIETKQIEIPMDTNGVGILFPELLGTEWSIQITFSGTEPIGIAEIVVYDR